MPSPYWIMNGMMMIKLPAVLDAQLQRDAGLTFFKYMVLATVSEQPGRTMWMSELAATISASLSRFSHIASRLEARGNPAQGPGARPTPPSPTLVTPGSSRPPSGTAKPSATASATGSPPTRPGTPAALRQLRSSLAAAPADSCS